MDGGDSFEFRKDIKFWRSKYGIYYGIDGMENYMMWRDYLEKECRVREK